MFIGGYILKINFHITNFLKKKKTQIKDINISYLEPILQNPDQHGFEC